MAATALHRLTCELGAYVAQAEMTAPIEHEPAVLTSAAVSVRRAQRLARLLANQPELRVLAAKTLRIRPVDIDAIQCGRVQLSGSRWRQLFDVLEPQA
ncbi:MAG TPA: hypothetical protein VHL31_19545 [Geminicoccus sp.]|uniref:hypothetical protein n=1 Tax=Geminicoccus sp. TaxID=2024832 RepID=UPI002E34F0A7|nr:hypothetical protein [Geminicoccus sp.]HEX2528481.1 hypothetical protein [Geminicoccus sp.]